MDTLFNRHLLRLLRHSVPRNDKLVFQKSGEDSEWERVDKEVLLVYNPAVHILISSIRL